MLANIAPGLAVGLRTHRPGKVGGWVCVWGDRCWEGGGWEPFSLKPCLSRVKAVPAENDHPDWTTKMKELWNLAGVNQGAQSCGPVSACRLRCGEISSGRKFLLPGRGDEFVPLISAPWRPRRGISASLADDAHGKVQGSPRPVRRFPAAGPWSPKIRCVYGGTGRGWHC